MARLHKSLDALGEELVACSDVCDGIFHDRNAGILPRTLFLERADAAGRGCLAIGLNPGRSRPSERDFYRRTGATYSSVKQYRSKNAETPYFKRTRNIIDQLGLKGPILWSNLAKCENEGTRAQLPPIQTLRHCTSRFLKRELEIVPVDWVILGVGREAYRALAYLVPQRSVIGIPHPTGGFRDFRKMLTNRALRPDLKRRVSVALSGREPGTAWLGAKR